MGLHSIASCITAFLILLVANQSVGHTAEKDHPKVITSARPMNEVARQLESQFAIPVTYEDPIWFWEGDVGKAENGVRGLYPRNRTFSMPFELSSHSHLNAALLGTILDAYHKQTDGPRFRIIYSSWGFHIVPSKARDSSVTLKEIGRAHV